MRRENPSLPLSCRATCRAIRWVSAPLRRLVALPIPAQVLPGDREAVSKSVFECFNVDVLDLYRESPSGSRVTVPGAVL